jgi:hypothetical protein
MRTNVDVDARFTMLEQSRQHEILAFLRERRAAMAERQGVSQPLDLASH